MERGYRRVQEGQYWWGCLVQDQWNSLPLCCTSKALLPSHRGGRRGWSIICAATKSRGQRQTQGGMRGEEIKRTSCRLMHASLPWISSCSLPSPFQYCSKRRKCDYADHYVRQKSRMSGWTFFSLSPPSGTSLCPSFKHGDDRVDRGWPARWWFIPTCAITT